LGAVLTTVDDFEAQVLVGKNDLELIGKRLRLKGTTEHELLAGLAEAGMRVIERDQIRLQPPDRNELDRTYAELKQVHAAAFGWTPPDVEGLERLPSNRMRQYVRAWINEWDLRRLDPSYSPEIAVSDVDVDLSDAFEPSADTFSDADSDGFRGGVVADPAGESAEVSGDLPIATVTDGSGGGGTAGPL